MLQLAVIAGPDKGRTFPLTAGESFAVGRSRASHTRLADPRVSRHHCRLDVARDGALLVDAGGSGGTYVNGRRVTEQQLRPGDVVQVGDTHLRLERPEGAEPKTLPPAAAPAPPGLPAERLHELTGTRLSRYEIGPVLARVNSGLIFQAGDPREGQAIALKVFWPEFSRDDAAVRRFIRAMKTVIPLRHPHLVTLYNAGKGQSYCWIAMEHVEGESIGHLLERGGGPAGKPDWRFAVRVAVHVSRALAFAHYHHIIHRDVAPQNVLLRTADQTAKLSDLMLAKAMDAGLSQHITRPGEILGDVRYMSPERTGGGAAVVDGRADLYSVGALTYVLLTGRPPLEGPSPVRTILKVRQAVPASPRKTQPAVPERLEAVVMKLLAKRPEERFQTAAQLLGELEAIARTHGVAV